MPRQTDPIWNHFIKSTKKGNSGNWARCSKCRKELRGIPSRLKCHFDICGSSSLSPTSLTEEMSEVQVQKDLEINEELEMSTYIEPPDELTTASTSTISVLQEEPVVVPIEGPCTSTHAPTSSSWKATSNVFSAEKSMMTDDNVNSFKCPKANGLRAKGNDKTAISV